MTKSFYKRILVTGSAGRLHLDLKGHDLTIEALSILKKSANLEFKRLIACNEHS